VEEAQACRSLPQGLCVHEWNAPAADAGGMTYNIDTDFLSNEDSAWLAEHYPEMVDSDGNLMGPYDYCPTCQKKGTYRWRGEEHQCDCAHQLQLHKWYTFSGIANRYQTLDWHDWKGDEAWFQNIRFYVDNPYVDRGIGVILYGPNGTGKTMIANFILKELVKKGIRCYATTFSDMIEAFTAGWRDDESKRWFERKFKRTRVLLLDDLGREQRGRAGLPQTTFENLLRARVQAGRPTLITTNMEPDEIGTGYGAAVLSMLREQSWAQHMTGADFRPHAEARASREVALGETRPIT
jgi:DNA replication protein DnaC